MSSQTTCVLTLLSQALGLGLGWGKARERGRWGTLTQKAEFQEINKGQCSSPGGRREPGDGMVWREPPAGSLDPGRETRADPGTVQAKQQKRGHKHPDFSLLPPSDLLVVPLSTDPTRSQRAREPADGQAAWHRAAMRRAGNASGRANRRHKCSI